MNDQDFINDEAMMANVIRQIKDINLHGSWRKAIGAGLGICAGVFVYFFVVSGGNGDNNESAK